MGEEPNEEPKEVLKMEIAFSCEIIGLITHFLMCAVFFYLLYQKKRAIRAEIQRTGRRPRDLRDSTVFLGSATLLVGFIQAVALLIENSMVKDCTLPAVNYNTIIWYVLHRTCLMSVYLDRLMTVFRGSQFAYPDWVYQVLMVSIGVWTIVSMGLMCAFYKANEIKIGWNSGVNGRIMCSWDLSNDNIFWISRVPELLITLTLFLMFVHKLVELYDKTEKRRRASEARHVEFANSLRSLPMAEPIAVEMGDVHHNEDEKELNDQGKRHSGKRISGHMVSMTVTRADTESDLFDTVTVPQPSDDDGIAGGRTRPGMLGPVTQNTSDLLHPSGVQTMSESPSLSPIAMPTDKIPDFPKISPLPSPIGSSPEVERGKTDRSSMTETIGNAGDHARSASSGLGFANTNRLGGGGGGRGTNTATNTETNTDTTNNTATMDKQSSFIDIGRRNRRNRDDDDDDGDGPEPQSRTWTMIRRSHRKKKKKSMNAHTFQIVFRRVFFSTATAIVSSFLIIAGYEYYVPLSGFTAFDSALNSFCVMTMFKFCQFLVAPVVGAKCDRFFCCKFVGGGYCNFRVLGYN